MDQDRLIKKMFRSKIEDIDERGRLLLVQKINGIVCKAMGGDVKCDMNEKSNRCNDMQASSDLSFLPFITFDFS